MQPYFMPYIGYFQLINLVDRYVIYDNIQYTKKGWINRNRILKNGSDYIITIPLKKDSDYLNICDRSIAESFNGKKLLNQITDSYRKAPYFKDIIKLLETIIIVQQKNLFEFIYNSIKIICDYLDIQTEIILSSSIGIDHSLKGKNKIIEMCKELDVDTYINAIGGSEIYNKNEFEENGIILNFLKSTETKYQQLDDSFIPNLSIIDVFMFNSKEKIIEMLNEYKLV